METGDMEVGTWPQNCGPDTKMIYMVMAERRGGMHDGNRNVQPSMLGASGTKYLGLWGISYLLIIQLKRKVSILVSENWE